MPLIFRRALGAVAIAVGLLLTVASAPALADASSCSPPTLTQPFSFFGDLNWYALVPGQDPGNFDGDGWVLGNGARLATTTVNGGSATVLQLPSGGWAMSPAMCIDPTYQSARMMVRSVWGSPSIAASVSYQYAWGWSQSQGMGQSSTTPWWRPSAVFTLDPASGWQTARFVLRGGGNYSAAQLYNFYIDPYGRG